MIPPTAIPVAQDPDELFDIVGADGRPTGRTKRRADVHRDGDWHRSIHVWVMGNSGGGSFLLCQRRGAGKDTAPLMFDATVGGHLRTGETVTEALREIEEEIGIVPDLDHLRYAGTRRMAVDRGEIVRDFEIQDIYLLRDDRPLNTYRPLAVEVDALVQLPLPSLLALLSGERDTAPATILDSATLEVRHDVIRASEFIPTLDNYFFRVAVAAHNALRGDRYIAV